MANISTYLAKILSAIYGEEVRGSIHDAIEAMNVESSKAMEFASTAKDSAQASAAEATQNAAAASQSAQSAKDSEINAKSAEASVASKAAEAVSAATEAKASETAAAESKTVAVQKAAEADDSKNIAVQKASEAAKSEAIASESAANAAASAIAAQQYSGKPPKPVDGTWWIWNAEAQTYVDSKIGCELVGPAGTGVDSIQLVSGDHSPGTTDTYAINLTDGTSYNISVYNGRNGTGSGDVLGVSFDLTLSAQEWHNGELTVADSHLMALATHKYLVDADADSREEYVSCNVQPLDITENGFIKFTSDADPKTDLVVNVIRFELSANSSK